MPLPPPPAIAFITIEEFFFKSLKKLDACFKDVFPCVPLTTGISNLRANFFASDLSPKIVNLEKDKQTVYIIRPNIHGVSSEFLDSIKIPKWFLGDQSIDRFCETFYNIHSSYSEKVIEYTGDAMTTSMPLEID